MIDAACPGCGGPSGEGPCPRCGRTSARPVSWADDEIEVDLGAAGPTGSTEGPRWPPPHGAAAGDESAEARVPTAEHGDTSADPTFELDLGEDLPRASPRALPVRAPVGRLRSRGSVAVNPGDGAGIGLAPAAMWASPLYAITVWRRRRALARELARQERIHAEAMRWHRGSAAELLEEVAAGREDLEPLLSPVRRAEAALERERTRLEAADGHLSAALRRVEGELARAESEHRQRVRDHVLARATMIQTERHLGVAIEVVAEAARALEEANRRGDGAADHAPLRARLLAAERARASREGAALAAREAERARARARREAASAIERLRRQRDEAAEPGAATAGAAGDLERARDAYAAACAEALSRLRVEGVVGSEHDAKIAEIEARRDRLDAIVAQHRAALDAFDQEAYHRGLRTGIITLAALLVLVLLRLC